MFNRRIKQRLSEFSKWETHIRVPGGKRAMIKEMNDVIVIHNAALNGDSDALKAIGMIQKLNIEIDRIQRNYGSMVPSMKPEAIIEIYLAMLEKIAIINRFNVPGKKAKIYLDTHLRKRKEEVEQRKNKTRIVTSMDSGNLI